MARRLSFLLTMTLVFSACVTGGTPSTTQGNGPQTTGPGPTGTEPGPEPTTTTVFQPTWTVLPGIEDLPQEVQDELLDLVRQTESIRGLRFTDPPHITVVSEAELESRVRALFEEESADFPADEALYQLLGLLGPDVDLETLLTDVYGEQVAGFYDGDTGELVVPRREGGFSVAQRSTLIHELTHALTDQAFDFNPVINELFDENRLDEASAFQGLIEGDASFAEFQWVTSLSQRELGELLAEAFQIDTSALDSAPQFVQDSLIFPYDTGLAFVQRLYDTGGWEAVNDAYATMPGMPGSTEQVMTPSDYGRDLPKTVTLPAISLPGYTLERQSVWGELGFRIMLEQILGESVAVEAADGWGGDSYYQWFDGQNAAMVIAYVGDTPNDLSELQDALLDYAISAVPEEDYVWVTEIEGVLYFIAADDPEMGLTILSAVEG